MTEGKWFDRAQCLGSDPDQFDVDRPGAYTGAADADALAEFIALGSVCDGCPVLAECARDALDHKDGGVIRGAVPLVHRSHAGAQPKNLERSRDALRLVACGAPPADARAWMLAERIKRARRTFGHPLYTGTRA